jgi:predicted membrane-bound spermidine synthase
MTRTRNPAGSSRLGRRSEEEASLVVRRREGRVDLILGNVVLLSSAALETEETFGALAPVGAARVLVGGLGFGSTLRGALGRVGPSGRVLVAEKVAAVEDLLRGELADLVAEGVLDDPRVVIERIDVVAMIEREASPPFAGQLDAILLDVDNGPEWASFRTNARLYSPPGLALAQAALKPGGILAVWSGYPADAFLGQLRKAGFAPSVVPLREKGVTRARAYVGVKSLDSSGPAGENGAP